MDGLRQVEDLPAEIEQLLVLLLLRLHELPFVIGQDLPLLVRPVLADHDEGREEDGFQADDQGQGRPG